MNKEYILQKDWGTSVQKGNKLLWYEGGPFYRVKNDWMKTFPKDIVENNPEWFKEKNAIVSDMEFDSISKYLKIHFEDEFTVTTKQLKAIKTVVESIININE